MEVWGETAASAHWDEKRREQRAECVISLGEACHFHAGGSPNMKGGRDRGETHRERMGGTVAVAPGEDVKTYGNGATYVTKLNL